MLWVSDILRVKDGSSPARAWFDSTRVGTKTLIYWRVAELVQHAAVNRRIGGSSPSTPASVSLCREKNNVLVVLRNEWV